MHNEVSQDDAPHGVNGVYKVTSRQVGKSVVARIRSYFTTGKIQSGDSYAAQSHNMYQHHLPWLQLNDQEVIRSHLHMTSKAKAELDKTNGSLQRLLLARRYKRVAKETFEIVVTASQRASDNLMVQITEAMSERGYPQSTTAGPVLPSPFIDSHAASTLTNIAVGNLDRVEMSTYQSEATGETTVVLDLHSRGASTQQVVATFPPANPRDKTDREADACTVSTSSPTEVFGSSSSENLSDYAAPL